MPPRKAIELGAGADGTASADAERLLAALRQRDGESPARAPHQLVRADAAVLSGVPPERAEAALQLLLREYRSHLLVTDEGELVYQFSPGLERRGARGLREHLARAGQAALVALWRGFQVAFKVCISVTLVAYTVIFALLGLALMLISEDDGPGPLMLWLLPDFLYGRRYPEDRLALTGEPEKKRFHRAVFDYVFGPREALAPGLLGPLPWDDRRVLHTIRARAGRVTATDFALLLCLGYERAEEEATRLLAAYDGEPEVTEDGILVYSFRSLRRTAAALAPEHRAGALTPGDSELALEPLRGGSEPPGLGAGRRAAALAAYGVSSGSAWGEAGTYGTTGPLMPFLSEGGALATYRAEAEDLQDGALAAYEGEGPLTGNRGSENAGITALNTFNLLAALTLGPLCALFLGLGVLGTALLSLVPLVFSLLFFAVPVGRALRRRLGRRDRRRRNLRRALFSVIGRRGGVATPPAQLCAEAVAELGRAARRSAERLLSSGSALSEDPGLLRAAAAELERLLVDLDGDVTTGEGGEMRYQFPRLSQELRAAAAARGEAQDRERELGPVIFSSASEGAGV